MSWNGSLHLVMQKRAFRNDAIRVVAVKLNERPLMAINPWVRTAPLLAIAASQCRAVPSSDLAANRLARALAM
jgi:hypothetical protein